MVLQSGEKKTLLVLEHDLIVGYQFHHDARAFSRLHRMEAWNDVMKVTRLETLFISVNKILKR